MANRGDSVRIPPFSDELEILPPTMKNLLQFGALDCIEISTTREAEFAKMNRYLVLDHERFLLRQ